MFEKILFKIQTGASLKLNDCNKEFNGSIIKIVENLKDNSYPCLNKSLKLLDLDDKKHVEIKKCLDEIVDVSIVKKIELFAENKMCHKNCLKCQRYYDIESGLVETICNEKESFHLHLCFERFKNTTKENGKVKKKSFVFTLVIIISLLTILASALLFYRRFKKNNNPNLVS